MKITLQINGREKSFSEEELIAKLEKLEELERKPKSNKRTFKVAQRPTEGGCFEVNPNFIDQDLFKERREDKKQELTRWIILKAFEELDKNPQKYSKKFRTMIPEKTWESKSVKELSEIACLMEGHIADWVEQALEWAQRIQNGETWEELCNKIDSAKWYRLVLVNEGGYYKIIGGACNLNSGRSATIVGGRNYYGYDILGNAVPLVVL